VTVVKLTIVVMELYVGRGKDSALLEKHSRAGN